jgi:TonB-linked SusC/RagA family outer membrane protein
MRKLIKLWSVLAISLISLAVEAQNQGFAIQGTVIDDTGYPLPGVSVVEKNARRGTITSSTGTFSLTVTSPDAVIEFAFVGMQKHTERVAGRNVINVTMNEKTQNLDEVVVVGYGTSKKSDLTAAVSSVSTKELSNRVVLSLEDAMKGKAAGLQITQNDGAPGSEYTIRIRGASSISASSTPLYVIDGVMQDDASNLNPGDVESIEILKDASGTSIYGSRGANGVILITTKSGSAGKTKVDFYMNMGVQTPSRLYDLGNSGEYTQMQNMKTWTYFRGQTANPDMPNDPNYNTTLYTYYRDTPLGTSGGFWKVPVGQQDWKAWASPDSTNTDWQRKMFQNASIQEYRLNVSGGSDKNKFSIMGGYLKQDGLVIFSGFERYTGRMNWEQTVARNAKLSAVIAANRMSYTGFVLGDANSVITTILRKPPTQQYTTKDYDPTDEDSESVSTNPYYLAKSATQNKLKTEFQTRMGLDWNLSRDLMFRSTGTYNYLGTDEDYYYPKTTASGLKQGGRALVYRTSAVRLMNEDFLYYKKKFNKNNRLQAMVGMTVEQSETKRIYAENQNFQVENLGVYGIGNGTSPQIPTYTYEMWRMLSFLSRAEYSLKDRYLLTLTMRADGSSRFGDNNKWGYFPSAALAWRISEEEFLRRSELISNLKLRLSVGQSGNTAIPAYRTLSEITNTFYPVDGTTASYGVIVGRAQNKDLKWETTTQYNAGLDVGLFNSAINLVLEGYVKNTSDLLIQKIVPGYSGYDKCWSNLGSIRNSGAELTISARPFKTKDFTYSFDFNIGFNRSFCVNIGPDLYMDPGVVSGAGNSALIQNGQPLGQWYGYRTNGIWQSLDEIQKSGIKEIFGTKIADIRPGSRKFIDMNNDSIINASDRTVLGKAEPWFTGGLVNNFSYKQFDLSVVFTYSVGSKIYNANKVVLESGRDNFNSTKAYANGWKPSLYDMNSGALVEAGTYSNTYRMAGNAAENIVLSDWIEDGSYLRLSDITLAYNFSKAVTRMLKISGLKVFASAKNVWLWTAYSGYDPEVNTRQGGWGDLMPSLDFASYPRARSYSLGFNVSF